MLVIFQLNLFCFLFFVFISILKRGMKFHDGTNVGVGRDHTIYALVDGHVSFSFDHKIKRNIVSVDPQV